MSSEEINAIRRWMERLDSVARWVVGSLQLPGGVQVLRNGVAYDGGVFVPLQTPLTSTSWDGDSFSTTAKTLIDLSAVFGVPAGIKAVYMRASARDSASAGTGNIGIWFSPNNTSGEAALFCRPSGRANDYVEEINGIVPCDSNGDIYYQCAASGANTLDVWIEIWGYWL